MYIHKIELSTGRTIITSDEGETYTYINNNPVVDRNGKSVPSKTLWTLGPVEEKEAERLMFLLASSYGCDVMVDGKLLGLPFMGKPGEWSNVSDAAAALGSIKTEKKAKSSAENGKLGGRPKTRK